VVNYSIGTCPVECGKLLHWGLISLGPDKPDKRNCLKSKPDTPAYKPGQTPCLH